MKYKFFIPRQEKNKFKGGVSAAAGEMAAGSRGTAGERSLHTCTRLHKNRRNTRKRLGNRRKIVQICRVAGRRDCKNNTN